MATIYSFTNEEIALHKEQQIVLFERVKVSLETYEYWFEKFMSEPNKANELKALKAFEFLTYDTNNMKLHQQRELEERLRVADELLKKHKIHI